MHQLATTYLHLFDRHGPQLVAVLATLTPLTT